MSVPTQPRLRGAEPPISTWTMAKRLAVAEEATYYGIDDLSTRATLPAWTKRVRKGAVVWWVDQITTGDPKKYHWHRSIVAGWKDRQDKPSLLVVGRPQGDQEQTCEPVGVTMAQKEGGKLVASIRFAGNPCKKESFYTLGEANHQQVIDIECDDLRVLCVECGPSPLYQLQHRRSTALGSISAEDITRGARHWFVEFKVRKDLGKEDTVLYSTVYAAQDIH